MTDDPLTVCPATGQPVTRVLFAPAIHFKGSGFHNTDNKATRPRVAVRPSRAANAS